jgi:hypothetical protein
VCLGKTEDLTQRAPREAGDRSAKGGGDYSKRAECAEKGNSNRDSSLRSADVAKLAKGDFLVSKLIVFGTASCGGKKSQPPRMTEQEATATAAAKRLLLHS